MSDSEDEAKNLASELKELPIETVEMSVQPEMARAELATCARGGAAAHGDGTAALGKAGL